ncbi:MAG TPA: transcription antitermination factor NusB [Actinopolymorphaceae bacterium]|jgi:transcription antitermination protein NusB
MAARTKARKRALDILFESELRGRPVLETLAERLAAGDPPVPEYTVMLVEGTTSHIGRLDELLSTYSHGWSLERMPGVDRNILRLGLFEVLYVDDVPDEVAISEAVHLAGDLSTDESSAFVNGLLARVLELKPGLPTASG